MVQHLINTWMSLTQNCEGRSQSQSGHSSTPAEVVKAGINSLNPLQIDLILLAVLSYLPVNSLLTFRSVNRFWNENAITCIEQKMKHFVDVEPQDFPKFVARFENTELLPF